MPLRFSSTFGLCLALTSSLLPFSAWADLVIPSDGSDGDLVIKSNTVIRLGEATTGRWDTPSPAAGKGVYDPDKWAVVFKYRSVSIASNATVKFENNATRAPVVWLVQGNVTIAGKVDLTGEAAQSAPTLADPGPGGFRGGKGVSSTSFAAGSGFGPGGGTRGNPASHANGPGDDYGNASLVPLVGGSGGGGTGSNANGGGAGGGAILIACSGSLGLPSSSSTITANGGTYPTGSGGGSGGGVRLVATTLSGSGLINAVGAGGAGDGRISLEAVSRGASIRAAPTAQLTNLSDGARPPIWPEDLDNPSVRILSIGGRPAPADPIADMGVLGADVNLARTNAVEVLVETVGVETNATVRIRRTPLANENFTVTNAVMTQIVSDPPLKLLWRANVRVADGIAAFQVHVIRP